MTTWELDKVKPWVASAAQELGNLFGINIIYGWRAQGSVPGSDHPKGLALDYMTTSGTALAEYGIANAQRLGIKYIVWNRHVWSRARAKDGWRPYTSTPNPHTDHVHISFDVKPPVGGAIVDTIGNLGQYATGSLFNLDALMNKARGTSITLIGAALGLGLLGAGLFIAVKQNTTGAIKSFLK